MSLLFSPMTEDDARAILAWRYAAPYDVYNAPDVDDVSFQDVLRELLDQRSPYFAVRESSMAGGKADTPPIGFFAYGSACEVGGVVAVPYLLRPDGSLTIGLGLRPDHTGQGQGLALVEVGLAFAREHYHPSLFRLYVYAWNSRAIRVYERAGFAPVGGSGGATPGEERVFNEMTRLP